jgi:hypothetical protein
VHRKLGRMANKATLCGGATKRYCWYIGIVHMYLWYTASEKGTATLQNRGINTLGFAFTPFPPDYQALT